MMYQAELPETVQHTITHQFYQARPDIDQWMTLAASVLAQFAAGDDLDLAAILDADKKARELTRKEIEKLH